MLALSATEQFHNKVNGSLMRKTSMPSKVSIINSCVARASLNRPIVGTATHPTDHPSIIGTPTVLPANRPTISSTSNPTKQVPRPSKNTEGETGFLFWSRYRPQQIFTKSRLKTKTKLIKPRHRKQTFLLLCYDEIGSIKKLGLEPQDYHKFYPTRIRILRP